VKRVKTFPTWMPPTKVNRPVRVRATMTIHLAVQPVVEPHLYVDRTPTYKLLPHQSAIFKMHQFIC